MVDTMSDFSIIGRVIDRRQAAAPNLVLRLMHRPDLRRAAKVLLETKTDSGGRFQASLDRAQLNRALGRIRRAPKVYLSIHGANGDLIYETRESPLHWQIEYRVFLGGGEAVKDAPDVYSSAMRRMITGSKQAGVGALAMKSMTSPGQGPDTATGGWKDRVGIITEYSEIDDSMNMVFAVLDGAMADMSHRTPFKLVGMDGAQVPRRAWSAPNNQAIIWPRKEAFRWD
jgi:hypothetical protein